MTPFRAIGLPAKTSAPLEAALSIELDRFEKLALRYLSVLYTIGIVGSLLIAATIARSIGLCSAAAAAVYLAWARYMAWRFEQGEPGLRLRAANVAVESSLPWVFAVLLIFSQNAHYALASWVPPMIFCGLVVAYTARLQPRAALIVGLLGGICYPAVYFAIARARLDALAASDVLYQPLMQVVRGSNLVLGGVLGAFVARKVRGAILRAGVVSREQDLFGKYRLLRELAAGFLGSVSEALYLPEEGFERRVALKRMNPEYADRAPFVEAFRREAALGARLTHPNVVQIIDFGRVGDTYFMSHDFVVGVTLARLEALTDAPFPPEVAGYLVREVLGGLDHAQRGALDADGRPLGLVHGNMSPERVLLSLAGEVKVRDFGVALALREAASEDSWARFGAVGYLAPEQVNGERGDARADVFAVGVMLWELLAGRPLFTQQDEESTLRAISEATVPPITQLRPELHSDWDALLERALARDPEQRFGSAREMAEALRDVPDARGEGASGELSRLVAEARARRAG